MITLGRCLECMGHGVYHGRDASIICMCCKGTGIREICLPEKSMFLTAEDFTKETK